MVEISEELQMITVLHALHLSQSKLSFLANWNLPKPKKNRFSLCSSGKLHNRFSNLLMPTLGHIQIKLRVMKIRRDFIREKIAKQSQT